ncbi:M28 family peptidase [Ginsengibacter hankyongi]|uniref:M28 family peptidase n=1 Tax=Ginsengibacter hankyongi TaxID=2607284 RepID=A0A5J5IIN6_9BACT|nr:M28 family peptidase [Ginsengibacter hankyongi]KAA9039473.1 M28 family peptidase [Ginsengibacter hankyongi]
MKNYSLLLIIFIFFTNYSFSQTDSAWKYAETITQSGLKEQLSIIASAGMEGRETGTEGQRKAAAYIESQFKKAGLTSPASLPGFQQSYPLLKDTLIPKTLRIGKRRYDFGTDYMVTPGTDETSEFNANDIIFAGYGIADINYNDYDGKDVKGKVVVIFTGEPQIGETFLVNGSTKRSVWGFSLSKKAIVAKQKGAKALLVVNLKIDNIANAILKTSNLSLPQIKNSTADKVPVITVAPYVIKNIFGRRATELIAYAEAGIPLKDFIAEKKEKSKLVYKRKRELTSASNVIGYIEGSDLKNEYVFLTAHYDHLGIKGNEIYYGADDDGSGTASVIVMAQAFARAKEQGYGPRRTLVFMTASGEEEGLWGSAYYSDHPVFPLDSTTVDLNTDMIGRIDPGRNYGDSMNYIYVIGNDKLSTDLDPITTSMNKKYTNLELDYKFNAADDPERIYFRSDHYNFAKRGVPIVFYFDGIHKDYHKPTDTVDKINFDLMEKRARFIFLTAWNIANRNSMLKRDLTLPKDE